MARIAGVELPQDSRIDYALTQIYGIGFPASGKILKEVEVEPGKRVKNLTSEEVALISKKVEGMTIEGDLRRKMREDIQRLKDIGTYRGIRHAKNLPVRGQRTRTNARTKRGKRRTVGAFKKEILAKQVQVALKDKEG